MRATTRINTPAPAKRAVRLHLLTAPEMAWEIGTNPVLDSIIMLIIRPSICLGVRICIQVNNMMEI